MSKSYKSVTKNDLRREMTQIRRTLTVEDRKKEEARLLRSPFLEELLNPVHSLFLYYSIKDEFPTRGLMEVAMKKGIRLYLPKVFPKEKIMLPGPYLGGENMVPGTMDIPEPREVVRPFAFDLILVPGLAFDRLGGRLGYGGGYYDRYLCAHPYKRAIALGFDFQVLEEVPMEETDCYLDGILTPSRLLLK